MSALGPLLKKKARPANEPSELDHPDRDGCKHCYAERMAQRLQLMGQPNYQQGFAVTLQEQMLELPLRWKKPQRVFVNSMSDLFHEAVPDAFIRRVFGVMQQASWHTFQVLTKRAERLEALGPSLPWPANVWMGVSVETPKYLPRLDQLRRVPARIRFVSFEPSWPGSARSTSRGSAGPSWAANRGLGRGRWSRRG